MLTEENKQISGDLVITKQGCEPDKSVVQAKKASRAHLFHAGNDPKRNLLGRPKGAKGFNTYFERAIKKIATDNKINMKDPETSMIVKAVLEAMGGNLGYFNSLMDRVHGRPREQITINSGELPIILEISRGTDRKQGEQTPPP